MWFAPRALRLVICATFVASMSVALRSDDTPPQFSVRITSPLGRMGASTNLRFVAQINATPLTVLQPVRFYVDGTLFKTDTDGPPYAVEWVDENPFERRELSVEIRDDEGHTATDSVVLDPFELVDATDVMSVLLEA